MEARCKCGMLALFLSAALQPSWAADAGCEPHIALTMAQVTTIPGVPPGERPTINDRRAEPFPLPSANLPKDSKKRRDEPPPGNVTGSGSPGGTGTGERHPEVIPSAPER